MFSKFRCYNAQERAAVENAIKALFFAVFREEKETFALCISDKKSARTRAAYFEAIAAMVVLIDLFPLFGIDTDALKEEYNNRRTENPEKLDQFIADNYPHDGEIPMF